MFVFAMILVITIIIVISPKLGINRGKKTNKISLNKI